MVESLSIKQVELLDKLYNKVLDNLQFPKSIRVGGALVTFPNKEKTVCELSTTYINKPGRFSKDQRVVITLVLNKNNDGVYHGNIDDSVFHIVSEDKGNLKELWSGNFKEATEKIQEVAKIYLDGITALSSLPTF